MKSITACLILLFASTGLIGQRQQTKTRVDSEGNKEVIDSTNGWTVTEKSGKVIHQSAAEMNDFCSEVDDPGGLLVVEQKAGRNAEENLAVRQVCDDWGAVQSKTHVEKMTFSQLMTRLLVIAPPSTSFARYRGMELKAEPDSTTYDATILPNDLGLDATCTIEEEDRHKEGMLYTYECSVKTSSFPAALDLKNRLVASLNSLHLTEEDEVREHGLAANARALGYCAPDGECMEGHIYVTAMRDWKTVQIDPNPILTSNNLAAIITKGACSTACINGIASDSADLTFQILSVGPNTQSGVTAEAASK